MFFSTNSRLQRLAVSCNVPAWNVMVDPKTAFTREDDLTKIVLLNKAGHQVAWGYAKYDYAWERMEAEMKKFAETEECKEGWAKYVAEGQPAIDTLGAM